MPRVHIQVQDIDAVEDWGAEDDWEQLVGTRATDERREAQFGSREVVDQRRDTRGSHEALARKRSERRKTVRRGGKR